MGGVPAFPQGFSEYDRIPGSTPDEDPTPGDASHSTVAGTLTAIERPECLALMATQPVGRLAFTRHALPDVIPVNFVLRGSTVLLRLRSNSLVARLIRDAVVAFQVDQIDVAGRSGWSVTVVGQARAVEPVGVYRDSLAQGQFWLTDPDALLVAISTERIAGRRLWHASAPIPSDGEFRDTELD